MIKRNWYRMTFAQGCFRGWPPPLPPLLPNILPGFETVMYMDKTNIVITILMEFCHSFLPII